MEKVCIAWWRGPDDDPLSSREIVTAVACSPAVRAATVHLESVDHPQLRYGAAADGRLLSGLASLWLDSYQDLPSLLPPDTMSHAWLVCESVPTPYGNAMGWREGARSPGLSIVTLLDKPPGLDEEEFYRCWHVLHRATTAECHPFTSYVRNEVARALTPGAPGLRGIVTESAPDLQDFLDQDRFYVSGGDRDRLRANQRRVASEIVQFIDLDRLEVAPMSEYVVRRLAPTSP